MIKKAKAYRVESSCVFYVAPSHHIYGNLYCIIIVWPSAPVWLSTTSFRIATKYGRLGRGPVGDGDRVVSRSTSAIAPDDSQVEETLLPAGVLTEPPKFLHNEEVAGLLEAGRQAVIDAMRAAAEAEAAAAAAAAAQAAAEAAEAEAAESEAAGK